MIWWLAILTALVLTHFSRDRRRRKKQVELWEIQSRADDAYQAWCQAHARRLDNHEERIKQLEPRRPKSQEI